MAGRITSLLDPSRIVLHLQGAKRTAALNEVARLLDGHVDVANYAGFYEELLARDRLDTTCLGNAIALPHARTEHVKQIVLAVGRCDSGIAFVAQPQIPPRNVNWSASGKWVHAAKIGFEKYFLRKMKKGTSEPLYEKYVMKAIGVDFAYVDASASVFARDANFTANLEGARAVGMQVGAVEQPHGHQFLAERALARRVLFTPHIAGVTRQASATLFREAWANVERVLVKGDELPNDVLLASATVAPEVVDAVRKAHNATATVFVKMGEEFVRVTGVVRARPAGTASSRARSRESHRGSPVTRRRSRSARPTASSSERRRRTLIRRPLRTSQSSDSSIRRGSWRP